MNRTTKLDGANPIQEISGTSASANLLAGGLDEFFQRADSSGPRSFLSDALGSTLALADSTGTVQTSYTFEPFGTTTVSGAPSANSFAFTARELDPSGLYFLRARYFSPSLQRFIAEDPIRLRGGINYYSYALSSPTNFTDPFGRNINPFPGLDPTLTGRWPPPTGIGGRKTVACASALSQTLSIHSLLGVPNLFGSNTVGDLGSLITGPESGVDPVEAGLEQFDQAASIGFEGASRVLENVGERAATTTFIRVAAPVSYATGVYNPVTLVEIGTETALGESLEYLGGIGEAKLAYDALIFAFSAGVCLYSQ